MDRRTWLLLISGLLLAGCAAPAPRPAAAPGAANVFPGFDTWRFPGDSALLAWRASPYRWIGYYLPSPCRRDNSWAGTRSILERHGLGVAVLYVGQQTFEGQPEPDTAAVGQPLPCSRTLLTAEQGAREAEDAANRAEQEGFLPGSVIFLNVERMETVPPAMVEYYSAWMRRMLEEGRYVPGTYAHRLNAQQLYELSRGLFEQAGRTDDPPFWIAGGGDFELDRHPRTAGFPFARVWQGRLDVDREWGGVSLRVDENVADRPSPSAPRGS